MTDGLDARAKKIIDEVIELTDPDRSEVVARLCGEDVPLRRRVNVLLAAADKDDVFLREPTMGEAAPPDDGGHTVSSLAERPGGRIGPYRLLELIGEGGFGTVFMAEQSEPVRRRVALKIIKLGMDTRAVVARFEQERQALALMDHPNIAKVLDAGATSTGRPYFVMELVKGEPITAYCDAHNLSIPERLELFTQVCRAVQHAHTKGVIHRDIKPGNVLVSEQDGRAHGKVIDFGIAKATQQPLTEKTIFTEFRQLVGTPEYMSPEQASGSLDIDTRSDVYSLGVLLYELLSGVTPLDSKRLRSAAFGEMQRMIREDEPPAPSTRLSQSHDTLASVAAMRRVEPRRLGSIIRGELDWIVMRALEKDRARRYDTAGNLAADVERFLSGDPVEAAPPGPGYRLKKFARRHRGSVLAGSVVGTALVVGLGMALWQARVASRERDAARAAAAEAIQARTRADQIAEFQASQLRGIDAAAMGARLREDLLSRVRLTMEKAGLAPEEIQARQARLIADLADTNFTDLALTTLDQNVFQRALQALDKQFDDQPLVKSGLLLTLADTMSDLGLLEASEVPLREGLAIKRRVRGDDHEETIVAISAMGILLRAENKVEEAEPYYREALDRARRVLGEDHTKTLTALNNLGMLMHARGNLPEAERCFRESLEKRRRIYGADDEGTIKSASNLGLVLYTQGKPAEAEPYFREALAAYRRIRGDDHPDTLTCMNNLGSLYRALNRYEDAEPLLRESLEKRRRLRGDEHPETLQAISNLGVLLYSAGKYTEAEPYQREVLMVRQRKLGNDHPETIIAMLNMGSLLTALGRPAEGEPLLRAAVAVREQKSGPMSVPTLTGRVQLGEAIAKLGRYAEAEALLLETRRGLDAADKVPADVNTRCNKALIELYEGWDKSEPGKGYDLKAAQMRKPPNAPAQVPGGKP